MSNWFAADRYAIADIGLYAYSHSAEDAGFDLSRYAAIQGWLDRVRNQQRHVAQMYDDSAVPAEAFI